MNHREREAAAEAARMAWVANLQIGDEVAWLWGGGVTITRGGGVTPTQIAFGGNWVDIRFYRATGRRIGDRWTRLVKPDSPDVLAARLREVAQTFASVVIREATDFRNRKGHRDPLVLANEIRDLATSARSEIWKLRERIDEQQRKALEA
jgi:hypothetical protein